MAPPASCHVIILGGGPAGSTAASLLAREGRSVVVLEREQFPRYHIGESLLPTAHPILDLIGAREKVRDHGFLVKVVGFFHLEPDAAPGRVDFRRCRDHQYSWQVIRSEFDHLLLQNAQEQGAAVFERTRAVDVDLDAGVVRWEDDDGETGVVHAQIIIDATGQAGILANRHLNNRRVQEEFANVALGSYWRGARPYTDAQGQEWRGAFSMEAHSDGSGWTWAIPLHDGTLSVGSVIHRDQHRAWHGELGHNEEIYSRCLEQCPMIRGLLAPAERCAPLRLWSDYSYMATRCAGPRWRMAGDAAGFVDPLFSSGVHLAMFGGLVAAATAAAVLRGDATAAEAADLHDALLRRAYARWIVSVAGFYQIIRKQESTVLPTIDARSFQQAFEVLGPLFRGTMDASSGEIPAETLRAAMRFGGRTWLETYDLSTDDPLARLAGRTQPDQHFARALDALDGWKLRLERGALGMAREGRVAAARSRARQALARGVVLASTVLRDVD